MRREKISLDKALKLESESLLTLYYPSTSHDDLPDIPNIDIYVENFKNASGKYRKIAIEKLLSYIDPEYQVEVELPFDKEINTFSWAYLYGKKKRTQEALDQSLERGKFVYVLINPAYPELVKIGKAVNPQSRIKGINSAGTVSEWTLYWAIPVTDDFAVETLAHQHFADRRVASDQGSSREFFEVSKEDAIEAIMVLASDFYNGEPTFY